jgi:hypothetical protein
MYPCIKKNDMATVATNMIINGLSGRLGRSLVFRTLRGKTFVSPVARKPDKKKETVAQRTTRVNFQQASEWAKMMMLNPEKKAYYKQRAKVLKLPNAYTAALTDYMRKPTIAKTQQRNTITYRINKPGFMLRDVTVAPDEAGLQPRAVTRRQNDAWVIDYLPNDDTPSLLTLIITDNFGREINVANGMM